ncbi:MAG: hypothetical protein J7518_12465 [Nocardioidaceae bacterium]|nr:hypothetical protein [Nocardioidaceae bacterium]
MSDNMHDMDGWVSVSCTESDDIRQGRRPRSSLTDPDGLYSSRVVYTEWATNDDVPVLRDYRYTKNPSRPCEHYVPAPQSPDPEASQAPRRTDSADRNPAFTTSGSGKAMVYSAEQLRGLSDTELQVHINHLADVIADSLLVYLPESRTWIGNLNLNQMHYWNGVRLAAVAEQARRWME